MATLPGPGTISDITVVIKNCIFKVTTNNRRSGITQQLCWLTEVRLLQRDIHTVRAEEREPQGALHRRVGAHVLRVRHQSDSNHVPLLCGSHMVANRHSRLSSAFI